MVEINGSVFIQIANFLVLIFLLNIVLYKPIRGILQKRKQTVEGLEQAVSKALKDADETNQAFVEGIRKARQKGQQEKEALIQAAEQQEKELLAKISEQARQDMEKVKARIQQDAQSVKEALHKEVDAFAEAICEKILGRAG